MEKEIGRSGQRRWGGIFYEEFLRELRGRRGIEAYREMSENDDVVGAILFAIEMLIRQVQWYVQPAGNDKADIAAAEFVDGCRSDMQMTWTDTISEILSFLTYGWSAHEIVYKRRMGRSKNEQLNSKYADGLIGWQKLPIRAQDTLYQWEYDDHDNLQAMTQMPAPSYEIITIPIEKLLLFRTKSRKDNPEGRSILRNAYRSWYFKRRIQEIEGIGIERDLAGFPVLIAPENVNIWDIDDPDMVRMKAAADLMVKQIRRDSTEGITLPADWKLELLSTGSRRQFDTNAIIERYDTRIAMTVLADFILLGHQQVGSFALSSDKTKLFAVAIGAYLDVICETFNNKAIPQLIDMNADSFKGITDYPRLCHGDIESQDLAELGAYIKDLTAAGIITPDSSLEDYIREQASLPERSDEPMSDDQQGRVTDQDGADGTENAPGEETLEADEKKAVSKAWKRLGRND